MELGKLDLRVAKSQLTKATAVTRQLVSRSMKVRDRSIRGLSALVLVAAVVVGANTLPGNTAVAQVPPFECRKVVGISNNPDSEGAFSWEVGHSPTGPGTGPTVSFGDQWVRPSKSAGSMYYEDGRLAAPASVIDLLDKSQLDGLAPWEKGWFVSSIAGWISPDEIVLTLMERGSSDPWRNLVPRLPLRYNIVTHLAVPLAKAEDLNEAIAVYGSKVLLQSDRSGSYAIEVLDLESANILQSAVGRIVAYYRSKNLLVYATPTAAWGTYNISVFDKVGLHSLTNLKMEGPNGYTAFRGALLVSPDGSKIATTVEEKYVGDYVDDRYLLTIKTRVFSVTTRKEVGRPVTFSRWVDTASSAAQLRTFWRKDGIVITGGYWIGLIGTSRLLRFYDRDVFLIDSLECAA